MKCGRHSIRLKGFDYSQNGYYFVTICTKKRICLFEEYEELRKILNKQWLSLLITSQDILMDEFVIMPNHIHGIIVIKNVGAGLAPALNENESINRATARVAPTSKLTLGEIIGIYKSKCCVQWLKYLRNNNINEIGSFWQRNYFERIIQNESEYWKIKEYIRLNPLVWNRDGNNPKNFNRI